MEHLVSTSDLVIGQWTDSPLLRETIDSPIRVLNSDVIGALNDLEAQRNLDTAEGIWLDFIGARLGVRRPSISDPSQDLRFGFDGVTQSTGFDLFPFIGDEENDAFYPMPDDLYRNILRARGIALFSDGSFQTFVRAVRTVDSTAAVRDDRDMSVRIATDNQEILEIADMVGALPRNAGVEINYVERGKFGYDEAGVPFDQGPFISSG